MALKIGPMRGTKAAVHLQKTILLIPLEPEALKGVNLVIAQNIWRSVIRLKSHTRGSYMKFGLTWSFSGGGWKKVL